MPENTRDHAGKWKPGQSPNPGGRPAIAKEVRELAQKHSPRAIERLVELVESPDERVAVAASTALLDRAVGKPGQAVELSGPDGAPLGNKIDLTQLSDVEVQQLQQIAAKAKGEE